MVKRAVFFGLTALALVYGLLVLVNAIDVSRKPSDEEQIRAAVEEMRQASLEGRDGGVIEYLSDAFELPAGMGAPAGPFNSGRDQVAKFIKNAKVETLEMKTDSVAINGASALANVVTAGTLSYQPFFDSYEFGFPDMQIEFRKETRKRLLIVPDPTWAVIRVHGISAEGFNR
ncbi:MAG: hypothetical protein M3R13_01525 [Armatimonadota bacterium]|nr:hypothetical protein [Armatimonadota bacterium]